VGNNKRSERSAFVSKNKGTKGLKVEREGNERKGAEGAERKYEGGRANTDTDMVLVFHFGTRIREHSRLKS
jgi:hypothetical protein